MGYTWASFAADDKIGSSKLTEIINNMNTERVRWGLSSYSMSANVGSVIDSSAISTIKDKIDDCNTVTWTNSTTVGTLITYNSVLELQTVLDTLNGLCVCNCNYSCTCNCAYACTCNCNYACTCQCNYSCTCNCNYSSCTTKVVCTGHTAVTTCPAHTLSCSSHVGSGGTDTAWTQPVLTSNGTIGGTAELAVTATSRYSTTYDYWKSFKSVKTDKYSWASVDGPSYPQTYTMYTYKPIKIASISIKNETKPDAGDGPGEMKAFKLQASNDNSTWVDLYSGTNNNNTSASTWSFTVNSEEYYQYHRFYITSTNDSSSPYYVTIGYPTITATYLAF